MDRTDTQETPITFRRPAGRPKGRQPDEASRARIRSLLGDASRRRDLLIEHLHRIQDAEGCLSATMLAALAEEMRLSQAEVFEVASFYHHFDLVADGECAPPSLTVRVCESVSCAMAGAGALADALPALLGAGVRVQRVPCVGRCEQAPVAVVGRCPVGGATPRAVRDAVDAGLRECPLPPAQDLDAYLRAGGYRALAALDRVTTGDTAEFYWGAGTFASRGAAVAGSAIHNAAVKVREKIFALASKIFEEPEENLEVGDGKVWVKSNPSQSMLLGDLALRANPTRGTIEPGVEPGLEATAYYGPPYGATGAGAVAMIVNLDPETMQVKVEHFVSVHDCGTAINPLILEGQVYGGISLGIGNAFYEKMVYDDNGQLLSASFMDYLMPQATDMPAKMELGHLVTTSPLNALGIKGVGEAGAIPTPAAFVQAVEDALHSQVEIMESNLNPSRIFEYLQKKQ